MAHLVPAWLLAAYLVLFVAHLVAPGPSSTDNSIAHELHVVN